MFSTFSIVFSFFLYFSQAERSHLLSSWPWPVGRRRTPAGALLGAGATGSRGSGLRGWRQAGGGGWGRDESAAGAEGRPARVRPPAGALLGAAATSGVGIGEGASTSELGGWVRTTRGGESASAGKVGAGRAAAEARARPAGVPSEGRAERRAGRRGCGLRGDGWPRLSARRGSQGLRMKTGIGKMLNYFQFHIFS
ncbi:hypothetical protein BS78_02G110700 [Paspalum vaginatum]|nr:hypothetical protein BS78_02G110700 [Paspalum vaginatum]